MSNPSASFAFGFTVLQKLTDDIKSDPGYYSDHTYYYVPSLSTLAQYVKEDLLSDSFSVQCVKITTSRPTSNTLLAGQSAICIRKGALDESPFTHDYHLMGLAGNNWYHKPGYTQILKLNALPQPATPWTDEHVVAGVAYEPTITYSGDIRYILYKDSHGGFQDIFTGTHYHDGFTHYFLYVTTCIACGDETSPYFWQSVPCPIVPCVLMGK